jgi:hypothetical protein
MERAFVTWSGPSDVIGGRVLVMILARRATFLAGLAALGTVVASGCLSLPTPPLATEHSAIGDAAPVRTLARTGASPGKLCLSDLWSGTGAVLVFYRGEW